MEEQDFQEFLRYFHFDVKRPSWKQLEQHIQAVLLDHKLGISDRRVFAELKQLVERHAIEIVDPITPQLIDSLLRDTQTRYLLPQVFPVDEERFVKPPSLSEQLDARLGDVDGEYIVVTGPPGSGKSTGLSKYFQDLDEDESGRFVVVRYYCFVRVHDNVQRLRLEAKSLRVNLLTELQRSLPHLIDERRFDYSEHRFLQALEAIGAGCRAEGKKLVIFLDGLDHVERDSNIRDSIIETLPDKLPSGIVFVIGTQELHHWRPLAFRHGRQRCHIEMPRFSPEETRVYIEERCELSLPSNTLARIQEKSGGLPLYLRYLAELAAVSEEPESDIESIPPAVEGDIRSYYQMLWAAFDSDGWADAKYLSTVLCCLRFSVHERELFDFQDGITDRPRFETAFRRVRHLLRVKESLVSIFHDSFRVFVLEQIDGGMKREISADVLKRLKGESLQSPRWFKHAFRYALDAHDYSYVLDQVNRPFVDTALMRFRDSDEIMDTIDCAIAAAAETEDLVALSRLGSLKFRTSERLELTISWMMLAEILLNQGRVDQVVDPMYSDETGGLLAGEGYSLKIILKLIEIGRKELAEGMFTAFLKDFRGNGNLGKQGTVDFARCAGIFPTRVSVVMRWIAAGVLRQDTLEPEELAPGYAPHLAAYIEGLMSAGRDRVCRLLKRTREPFPNNLMRHLIIRAVAKHESRDVLRSEIEEYAETHPDDTNVELGYFAAKAGLSTTLVNRLAGHFDFPPERATHGTLRADLGNHLRRFAYWAVVFGYVQDDETVHQVQARLVGSDAVWSCAQKHLLSVGDVVGSHLAEREVDWFAAAEQAIVELEAAADVGYERTPDALDACRSILPQSLFWLGEVLAARCPDRLNDWMSVLLRLRESFIWQTHYGIGEYSVDYSFEFSIWESYLATAPMRSRLKPVLSDCAKTYDVARALKGGSRGNHFLSIAANAARCGYKNDADEWMRRGIETSLAYGYRKDTTLSNLTDIVALLDRHQPGKTLSRCAAILEMVKWMPETTDGRMTDDFAQELFPIVIGNSRSAGLELLRLYYEHFAQWQANESLDEYIVGRSDGDAEYLWALAALLDPNASLSSRQHIAELGAGSEIIEPNGSWVERLSRYAATMVNPRHWPDELWREAIQVHARPERTRRDEGTSHDDLRSKKYQIDGVAISADEARDRCRSSFAKMIATLQKLKDQNQHVLEYDLVDATLPDHITNTTSLEDLASIRAFCAERGRTREAAFAEQIGRRYLELGDVSSGLECLEESILAGALCGPLTTLAEYDHERARALIVSGLQERLLGESYHGFNTPKTVAIACDILGEVDHVEKVFEDYLQHCQELFAQLPDEQWFDELREWGDRQCEESVQVVDLLIDGLKSRPTEHGDRLVMALGNLCAARGTTVVPILVQRTLAADGLQLWRLLNVISNLAVTHPALFRQHCQRLIRLVDCDNVLVRQLVSRSFEAAFEGMELPTALKEAIRQVEHDYSSTVAYRGFGILHVEPTQDFVEITRNGAQVSFRRQLKAACQILGLDLDAVTAHLERRLLESGFGIAEERDAARAMWRAFSHPQGWPVVWFMSDFHVRISNLLFQTLDEILIKQRHQPNDVEALWRVLQPTDPEFCAYRLLPMPNEIRPLTVTDKDDWLGNGEHEAIVTIEDTMPNEWITAFEFRQLAQDNAYHIEYIGQTRVRSALVCPESVDKVTRCEGHCWGEKVGTHHPAENLTWQQFQDALLNGHKLEPDEEEICVPFVSYKERHLGFLGFPTLASSSSHVTRELSLVFDGFCAYDGDDLVGCFEAWQEGYSDEDCKDQPLSFGVRFRVKASFVQKVCEASERAFAVRTIENRFVMEEHKQDPVEHSSSTMIDVWPFPRGIS